MVRRLDSTRPSVRIEPNTDPTKAIKFLYANPKLGSCREYGKPMAGDGLVDAKQNAREVRLQQPQDIQNQHGAGYDNQVASDWRRGMGSDRAEGRPGFDHSHPRHPAKSLGGGRDASKSPFSAAHRNFK